eukprot:gene17987-18223_t
MSVSRCLAQNDQSTLSPVLTKDVGMSISSLIARLSDNASLPAIEHADMLEVCERGDCSIIDVREPNEYASGHIPGAKNYPLSSFNPDNLPKGKPVILVCQAGGRSSRALQQAIAAGHREIVHYAPGTGGWKASGGKIEL